MSLVEGRNRLRISRSVVWVAASMAVGVVVWAVPEAVRFLPAAPSAFWAMALAALVVDVPLFGISRSSDPRIRSTLSVCFSFAIFVLWGAAAAVIVQVAAGAISAIGQRYHPQGVVYMLSRLVLAVAAAGLLVDLAGLAPVATPGPGLDGAELLRLVAVAGVWFAVSHGVLAVGRATVSAGGLRRAVSETGLDLAGSATVVLLAAPLLSAIPGWWTLLVAVPLVTWNLLARRQLRREQRLGREPVSGLLNRQGLVNGLRAITARDLIAPEGPRPFGIVLVSFESVRDINRTLGRDLYERVVAVASRRLVDAYGQDRVARLSGEGVVILMPDLTAADALVATQAAAALLEPPIEVDGIPFVLDPACGVALSPAHGRDLGTLLMKAELAAGEARRTGRRAVLYVRQAAELTRRRVTWLRELRAVLRDPDRHPEIAVLYQPQVHMATGGLAGVEALLRWTHPQWGPIPTDELIDAIEASEIMHMLTRHVLESVAAQVRRWNEQGDPMRVSVNVSVQDLHEPAFVSEVVDVVHRHDIPAQQLVIEMTERMLISDLTRVVQVANSLIRHGIGLSLDDFGTGYASLQQLRQVPLTEVKVDRSYVRGMVDNPADRAIVTSVHQLARALHVDVVAEGVEDRRTADTLAALGGVIGQGWYFGRPMTVEGLRAWRRRQTPLPAA